MKIPKSIEEAQHILEKKGIYRDILLKDFFNVPVKIIKLQDKPKTYLIEVNQPFLNGLTILTSKDFKPIKGAGRTIAYLAKAYFLKNKKGENRNYPDLCLKHLYFTKSIAELECKEFIKIIEKIIEEKIQEAEKHEKKEVILRDIEEFQCLAEELKEGLE
ncbi:MAG: hypothetical protein ACTSYQ_02835, partial [Candidatus Odinarchaeia archaeon]